MAKRVLLLLLVCLMALPLLVACNNTAGTESVASQATSESGTTSEDVSEDTNVYPDIIDLNDREINILQWGWGVGSSSIYGFTGEIVYSEESDPNYSRVDVAKKEVIDYIESNYNCTIGGWRYNESDFVGVVQQMVTSGTYDYDIVFSSENNALKMLSNNLLTDLKTVPTLHFENSWWDQNSVEDLSINGRLFAVCGDINTYDNLGTWCILFNKKLKTDLGINDDFYQKATDGEWTMDYFMEICRGVTQEYDGKDGINEFDLWAVGTETFNIYAHMVGGGMRIAEKDPATDIPYLTVSKDTERTYNALQKILDFYNSDDVMVANGGKYNQYSNPWESTIINAFKEGRELFYVCGLISIAGFRNMEDPFGILPMPKLFAEQDRYYHTVSPDNCSFMVIPYGIPGIEELGVVIEAIAMKSQEIVTPEFYEVQLKGRDARDNESEAMLDIIYASRCFDLGVCYNWGGIAYKYYEMSATNIASRFDSVIDAAEQALQDTLDDLEDYEPVLN
ncbi:MAG: extracellular solute-binding protein [Clostridia bacterium]|nr:extracellular solute-binding protein [Clostridia bacterium]